jgi:hypothetical protein
VRAAAPEQANQADQDQVDGDDVVERPGHRLPAAAAPNLDFVFRLKWDPA